MRWTENMLDEDYIVEVFSLPWTYRDRERIGTVVESAHNFVIFQTDTGEKIKWVNGKLLRLPEALLE